MMNLCFLKGKIISEIQFDFILNSSNISVCTFKVELTNKSEISVKAYNEIADKCYQKLLKNDIIGVQGYLNSNMHIIVENIQLFNYK